MADPATSPAASLSTRYRIERELGRGAMATVYLAHDLRHDRPVALKVLHAECSASVGATRFLREIHLTAQLQHPGILPLFDSGEAGGRLWYAMPYVEGGTLRERLRSQGSLPVADAVQLVRQVAVALAHAHRQDVIHRDLKPENILLSSSGPVVADFGIARALSMDADRLTETGIAVGTPEYMSPEQASVSGQVDARSDVYALASVLYELLTGEPPYTGPTPQAVLAKRLSAPVPRISIVRPDMPPLLEHAITRALAKTPADRYASAAAFAAALDGALSGAGRTNAIPLPMVRRRTRWRAAALTATIAAITAAAALWRARRAEPGAALDPNIVAVLPFRVTAPDSASNYLREGVVDLLNARLTGEGVPRAVDSRTTLASWRRATGSAARELTSEQAVALAAELGAGQLVLGELVRTSARMTVSGRVLRVPTGELVVEHAETTRAGVLDELGLIDRWFGGVWAVTAGEGRGRVPQLSDSAGAVKAYLAGRQAYRLGDLETAAAHYRHALGIDSTFALAAYWLAIVSNSRHGIFYEDWRRAWLLRDRLNERDRAQLMAEGGIGPRYPGRWTSTEIIHLSERAAELNPDRPEALDRVGTLLLLQGAAAGVDGWLSRGAAALDSAIRLDSTHSEAMFWRLYAALISRDAAATRRYASLFLSRTSSGYHRDVVRWVAAAALGDSAALSEVRAGFDRLAPAAVDFIAGITPVLTLPLDDVEESVEALPGGPDAPPDRQCQRLLILRELAALRGRVRRALALVDSLNRNSYCGSRRFTMLLSLVEPAYSAATHHYGPLLSSAADTTIDDPDAICVAELWRVSRGDTARTRRNVERIRTMVRNDLPPPIGVGSLGTCALMLEAMIEALQPREGRALALERFDSLMRLGVFLEGPDQANLLLARMLEARGDLAGALAAVRRRTYHFNLGSTYLYPTYLQEEGRLAALTGDTAGAIRAYQHYLRLRDRPDPGQMADQVRRAKAHLAELVGEPSGR